VETSRIAELLAPFTGDASPPTALLARLQLYLDLLLRWNARVNLTAVRSAESIVTRHFGESLFAGRVLLEEETTAVPLLAKTLADVGSGAGFPGIPIKLYAPHLELTLIEAQNKKATFLREALRTLELKGAEVFPGRAEEWGRTADLVTLRAVEKFENVLPVAARLVAPQGRLGLLVAGGQADAARKLLPADWDWRLEVSIPQSDARLVCAADRRSPKPASGDGPSRS
jgi:16S rRNA (guanine527-N7)-methyltransferase